MAIARNSLYSALGSGIPLVVTIVTLPLLIGQIGLERYGVLAIAWLILVYVGQADFGLGRAVTQRIASAQSESASAIASTGFVLAGATGAIMSAIACVIAFFFFGSLLDVAEPIRAEMMSAIWLIGASTLCVALFAMAIGCLSGEERFGEVSLLVLFTNSALQIFPLLTALLIDPSLWALMLATFVARLLGLMLAVSAVWQHILRKRAFAFSQPIARKLMRYGKWIMISTIARPIMSMADRFIIGAQLGAVAVAAYSVPYQIASRTQLVPQAVIRVLFPRFSALNAEEALATARQAVVMLANLSVPFTLVLICLSSPLLNVWLGDELDERSVLLARLLLAAFWLSGLSVLAATFIQARGQPQFTAGWHTIQLPFYIAALFLLAANFGLVGFALVFLVRTIIDSSVLMIRAELLTGQVARRMCFAPIAVSGAILLHPILTGWTTSLIFASIFGMAATIIALLTCPTDYRAKLFVLLHLRQSDQ